MEKISNLKPIRIITAPNSGYGARMREYFYAYTRRGEKIFGDDFTPITLNSFKRKFEYYYIHENKLHNDFAAAKVDYRFISKMLDTPTKIKSGLIHRYVEDEKALKKELNLLSSYVKSIREEKLYRASTNLCSDSPTKGEQ